MLVVSYRVFQIYHMNKIDRATDSAGDSRCALSIWNS